MPAPAALTATPLDRPLLLGSEVYRDSSYGRKHPLSIPRVSATLDLIRAMGWLDEDFYRDTPQATPEQLARYHHPAYIEAVRRTEASQRVEPEVAARFNIGKMENPVFPEMYRRPATACGASIMAARLLRHGGVVHSVAGGTHHGRPDRASGFCYFNDPVLGILEMLDQGLERILYVDIDAHHGDGVQDAFHDDPRVLTISLHDESRWPHTGKVEDRAGGMARNLPLPAEFNDTEFRWLVDNAVLPLARSFRPEAVVLQCGADSLADDPMSRLSLSNRAYWWFVRRFMGSAPRLLVLGGGGYNPWALARCWAGIWAVLNGIDPAVAPTPAAEAVLRAISWNRREGRDPPERWFTTLADTPNEGPVRDAIPRLADMVLAPPAV
ncbi:MAG TPA: acetoin utilization protein AcuC [Azospirillaceae bacterium]|nr:acetoin utilization protein AcuC [Azospirillaceae bacterium]